MTSLGNLRAGVLVSLWDMLKLNARSWVKLGFASGNLDAMMNPEISKLSAPATSVLVPASVKDVTLPYLQAMRAELAIPIGAKTAIAEIDRLIALIENGNCSAGVLQEKNLSIYSRIEDELQGTHFLWVQPGDVPYFDGGPDLFGPEVAEKFPGLIYDIDEAGKCLALGRSTASAFHSLRCLEGGIAALSRCLGIPDPTRGADRNWGAMLGKVRDEMDRRWPKRGPARMSGDGQLFENAYAALAAMQNPWRNATMHLEQKCTAEEADHLIRAVRDFMQRLAKRMDEDGKPEV